MMMLAMLDNKCFLMTLSGHETTDVHTTHGLHTLVVNIYIYARDSETNHAAFAHFETAML